MELYPAYYSYRSFHSRQLQTILSHQFSQFISNQCKPCDVITQRRYHLSAVRSSVSKWRFQVNMASGGWRRPTSTETMGEPTKLPPTYFVICFHEKCSQEAVDFISDRLVAPEVPLVVDEGLRRLRAAQRVCCQSHHSSRAWSGCSCRHRSALARALA